MRLRGKLVGTLTPADIDSLVEHQVRESRAIEYKGELPGGRDDDRKELLADVSAIANTTEGVIVESGAGTTRRADVRDAI